MDDDQGQARHGGERELGAPEDPVGAARIGPGREQDRIRVQCLTRLLVGLPRAALVSLVPAEDRSRLPPGRQDVVHYLAQDTSLSARSVAERLGQMTLAELARRLCLRRQALGARQELISELVTAVEGWLGWDEARNLARKTGIRTRHAWLDAPALPAGVPRRPDVIYLLEGWCGWASFLGVVGGGSSPRWRPFSEARAFARGLHLLSKAEWQAYCRGELSELRGTKPEDVPRAPSDVYVGQFLGWTDWLDTERSDAPEDLSYRTFRRARALVRSLGFATKEEYLYWRRGGARGDLPAPPSDLPHDPEVQYVRGWRGWADWLGERALHRTRQRWRPFPEARAFARSLGLPDLQAWRAYASGELEGFDPRPEDVPSKPDDVYVADGWCGYADWLGTSVHALTLGQRPFEEARAFARSLGLQSLEEWEAYCRGERPDLPMKPPDVPSIPVQAYAGRGWAGMRDWLGPRRARFRSFAAAREHARSLGLQSAKEWARYARGDLLERGARPEDVPVDPYQAYRDAGWISWGDFLGTGRQANGGQEYLPYEVARAQVRQLGLGCVREWQGFTSGACAAMGPFPPNLPRDPARVYADVWQGYADWLGTGRTEARRRKRVRSYAEARSYARAQGLSSPYAWTRHVRTAKAAGAWPGDLPALPERAYRGRGWVGWNDFLGLP